jgi:hypothetical protein
VGGSLSPWLIAALCPVFALVAGAYAAVGLGGGTGYLAVMALVGLPQESMASTALILNLVVTGAALARYGLAGRLPWGLLAPFLVPAIPAALLGGLVVASRGLFLGVLAAALGVAGVAMLRSAAHAGDETRPPPPALKWAVGLGAGALIGFVSGFVGIGGGVFLGPTVLLLRWAGPKEVAAMNAATVLVLSAVGLVGHGLRGGIAVAIVVPFGVAVLVGGLIGAWIGEARLSPKTLQRVFAVIIFMAGAKAATDAALPWLTTIATRT